MNFNATSIGGEFDPEKFGKFIYYNDTWDVATASKEDVKNWGEVVWERNEKPIIVVGNLRVIERDGRQDIARTIPVLVDDIQFGLFGEEVIPKKE